MSESPSEAEILQHYRLRVGSDRQVYLLQCDNPPVTVRSQQIRALNLAWALREELKDKTIVKQPNRTWFPSSSREPAMVA